MDGITNALQTSLIHLIILKFNIICLTLPNLPSGFLPLELPTTILCAFLISPCVRDLLSVSCTSVALCRTAQYLINTVDYEVYCCVIFSIFLLLALSLSKSAQAIAPLTCIREVPGSNLGRDNGYPKGIFRFSKVLLGNAREVVKSS